ncbi:MAG TPA: signal peptidase II, partial [Ktedonobacterales bacterium]
VAFSMFEGQTVKFLFIAIAIAVISFLYWRTRNDASLLLKASFGLVLGGGAGRTGGGVIAHW